jgi:hypothetical protein
MKMQFQGISKSGARFAPVGLPRFTKDIFQQNFVKRE